jgi:ABC-type multidrug transport system fused ATPase/permease subunit
LGATSEGVIALVVFVLVPVGGYLFKPIRDELDSFISNLFIKKSIYRICIFGRPGSGKSTFIETAFTLINPNRDRRSTEVFDYYEFKVQLGLRNFADVAIADYKGQNPSQVIIQASPDFFGSEGSRVINAVLLIVDLVPRKTDEKGKLLSDEALFEWLKQGDIIGKIEARIQEHHDYINEASLELLFASLYSSNLKSVIFLINKLDLIDNLINDGYITLNNFRNGKEYAKHKFEIMIKNISRACSELKIEDFSEDSSVFTVCAKKTDDLKPLIVNLLGKRN